MERKGTVFRKYGKREQTSSEKPFKVLFKLIEDGEFNFIYIVIFVIHSFGKWKEKALFSGSMGKGNKLLQKSLLKYYLN